MAVGKKFSIDFQQATEISGNTQILVQPEGQPVEKASVEQLGLALINENIVPSTGGNYPKMSVGFTENVVSDGSATAEEFSFRPTAGVNRNTLNDGAARIHTLKGNSVVRNQLISHSRFESTEYYNTQGGATLNVNDGIATITLGTSNYSGITNTEHYSKLLVGHKYLFITEAKADAQMQNVLIPYVADSTSSPKNTVSTEWRSYSFVYAAISNTMSYGPARAGIYETDFQSGDKIYIKSFRVIDLTQEFGAGNEPKTVEEYYQRKPILLNEYEYNEGKLVNLVPQAIKTTGFNQWDEQWEVGMFNKSTGEQDISYENIRNVNPIRVLPNTTYYEKQPSADSLLMYVLEYTQDGTYIGFQYVYHRTFTTSPNTAYVNFYMSIVYGTVYNNDICISLYWPTEYGNLYGTYKPYKPFERDLSWVAKYFPNGMRSAGNVADEIRFNSTEQRWEAVQRVGVVDLGSLEWSAMSSVSSGVKIMRTFFDLKALATNVIGNITSEKYTPSTADDVYLLTSDKTIAAAYHATGDYIAVYDSEYPTAEDVPSFEVAMQGVLLNYELAEPIVTPITENINFDYDVSDYGTEELIVAEGVESAPLSASIEYSPNVLAILKNAPGIANDVDMLKSQLSAITAQLATLTLNNN